MTAKKQKKSAGASAPVLSPKDILKHLENEVVFVSVPEWGATVECRIPDADELFKLRMANSENEAFQKALFKASLLGFTDKDIEKLEKGNGLKYFQLFTAVMGCTDLFTTALKEDNIKK